MVGPSAVELARVGADQYSSDLICQRCPLYAKEPEAHAAANRNTFSSNFDHGCGHADS